MGKRMVLSFDKNIHLKPTLWNGDFCVKFNYLDRVGIFLNYSLLYACDAFIHGIDLGIEIRKV